MRPENENCPGGNLGSSDQQQATTRTANGDHSLVPPYRVVWSREGWGEHRERAVQTMDAARALARALRRPHPAWPALLTLRTDEWIEGAAIGGAWGAIFTHMDPTDSTRSGDAS